MNDEAVGEGKEQAVRTERSVGPGAGVALVRQETVVLLIDLVESVRLMREQEAVTVRRWADFVHAVTSDVLPRHRGMLVKSLGDGLLVRFKAVPDAVNAAAEMHRTIKAQNAFLPENEHFNLRAGINAATAWSDGIDIYGTGVNLAARLATLAGPGETIASASAHEQLAAALGEPCQSRRDDRQRRRARRIDARSGCVVRRSRRMHSQALRQAGPGLSRWPAQVRIQTSPGDATMEQPCNPTIAVIPFSARSDSPRRFSTSAT